MQAWGLIVLLISKAAGHLNVDEMEEDKAAGVLHSQRALAEVTEMIRTSHLVHNGLVNIYPGLYPEPVILNDMAFGNKIALLSGDYLLSNSCAELASLRNQDVSNIYMTLFRFKFNYLNDCVFFFKACRVNQ
jgi:decaprenyl-diphosphate synthase subunit 2